MVGTEFYNYIERLLLTWWPAREIVYNSFKNRENIHISKRIVILSTFCPWTDHIFDIEKEDNINNISVPVLYVIYPDSSSNTWRIQCVPENNNTFTNRKSLPEKWCGLRDENLSNESNIENCIFVHASGFIGGNKTKEGAIQMAIKALEL